MIKRQVKSGGKVSLKYLQGPNKVVMPLSAKSAAEASKTAELAKAKVA